ncbi:MAG: hypothetical protein H7Y31_18125 [Chitinophagaceae bacterium]|nr:hypothetical protein [Chitinophagaceae bacterium]
MPNTRCVPIFLLLFPIVFGSCAKTGSQNGSCLRNPDAQLVFLLENSNSSGKLPVSIWKADEVEPGYLYCQVPSSKEFPYDSLISKLFSVLNIADVTTFVSVATVLYIDHTSFQTNTISPATIKGISHYAIADRKMTCQVYLFNSGSSSLTPISPFLSAEVDGIYFEDIHSISRKLIETPGKKATILVPNYVEFEKLLSNPKNELQKKLRQLPDFKSGQ